MNTLQKDVCTNKMNEHFEPRPSGEAMKELIEKIESHGIEFSTLNALEIFGKDGMSHTLAYANKVKTLEMWEIDPQFEEVLHNNLPNASVKIIDSIKTLKDETNLSTFDFIVIDTPMATYGPVINGEFEYCEHFDFIKEIYKISNDNVIIVINVNESPYNYEQNPLWEKRRIEFFGDIDTANIDLEFLIKFYEKLFLEIGFKVIFQENVIRAKINGKTMMHYIAYKLKQI